MTAAALDKHELATRVEHVDCKLKAAVWSERLDSTMGLRHGTNVRPGSTVLPQPLTHCQGLHQRGVSPRHYAT